jgi:hypothetical protein
LLNNYNTLFSIQSQEEIYILKQKNA